jgi:hypothetical protein
MGGLLDGDDDGTRGLADEAPLLLPLPDHVDGELRVGVLGPDERHQLLVHRVSGVRERPLVLFGRVPAPHDAEVGCPGADVDDHRVEQRVHPIGHGKRLGHDHQGVGDPLDGVPQVLPAHAKRLGRHAHDRADRLTLAPAGQGDQVPQELPHRQLVPLGPLLD